VECDCYPIRSPLGDACQGGLGVRLLEGSGGWTFSSRYVQDSTAVLNVESMERADARCFEDCEKTREELKNNLVKSLFSWTVAHNISQFSNFFEFVDFCFSFSMKGGLSLYT